MTLLRPITAADRAFVLALNEANVSLLAPLSGDRLSQLQEWADLAAVVDLGDGPVGFVLTFAPGTPYDSPNYAWFTARYPDFYYLDRIVLAPAARRGGLGGRVYDEVEERAAGRPFCIEVNLEPPNEPSLAFHAARGFVEVGRLGSPGRMVSLQALSPQERAPA